ncbi:MAG: hypothetical protein ACREMN_10390 [Gemmatimonadales bacterium]
MARRNNAGSKRTRKSSRAKQQEPHVSWPGKVARTIRSGIKKLVG